MSGAAHKKVIQITYSEINCARLHGYRAPLNERVALPSTHNPLMHLHPISLLQLT